MDELIYIENTMGGDISIVDAARAELTGSIEIGGHLDDVVAVAQPGETTLLVNRQDQRDLVAVDVKSQDISWKVSLEGLPHHLALSGDGRHLYVALFDQAVDNVVDLEARAIVARPATGLGSHGVFLSPNGERFYVGSMLLDHIAVVDATTFQTIKTIPMDAGVRPFDITQDEQHLYAQLSKTHGFVVVSLATDETIARVDLPPLPDGVTIPRRFPHTVDHGLKISPDGALLFCAATIAGYVAVYDIPDHRLVTTIPVGAEPGWVVISGARCYVTNRAADSLSIISIDDLKEVSRVSVGKYPQRMAIIQKENSP